jgi:YD repeat-containing protein
MQKKLLYCLSVFLLILNSCSTENYDSSENTILPKTLITLYPDNPERNFVTKIIYEGNKIVSISNKSGRTDYTYDGDHILSEIKYNLTDGQKVKYTKYGYTNDSLKTVTTSLNEKETKYVYIYNDDGTISKETYDLDSNTGKESKKTEQDILTFVNGNVVKSESNWGGSGTDVLTTSRYEYDTNNNAFKNITGLNLLLDQANFGTEISFSSANNLKRHIVFSSQGPSSNIEFEPYANTMKYEYNKRGYPTKKTTYDYAERITEIVEYTY